MGSFEFVYTENGDQQRFSFDSRDLTIGRSPDCDFVLDHPTVSREHARLIDEGADGYRLIVQSEKGLTAVNGQEVSGQVRVQNGAEVYFGRLSFQFRTQDGGSQRQGARQQGGQARGAPQESAGQGAPSGAQQSGAQQPGGQQNRQQQSTGSQRQPAGQQQRQSAGQQGQQPPGGSQWDSYEDEVSDDPVGGAGGEQSGPTSGTSQNFSPGDDDTGMTEQEELRETVGIESWDDIAESARQEEEEEAELPGENRDSDEEQTNPLLIVAAVGALGFVGWLYMSGPEWGGGPAGPGGLDKDSPPVRITVECLAPAKCMRKAMQSYQVGVEMLNKSGAEITNLFNGYKKLLKAEAFVEKAGKKKLPKKMKELKKKKQEARDKLDRTFQNFRVKYHSAKKEGNHRAMAEALRTIQQYFPDKSAREHRWARDRILQMKRRNTYPSKL